MAPTCQRLGYRCRTATKTTCPPNPNPNPNSKISNFLASSLSVTRSLSFLENPGRIFKNRSKMFLLTMLMGVSVQSLVDLAVAGISLVIGLGFFAFVATILCSAAFLHNAKDVS